MVASFMTTARENRIDLVLADAPILAEYGDYQVGVRTMSFTDPGRIDVLNTNEEDPPVIYDRTLTAEIWYPAYFNEMEKAGVEYTAITRNPSAKQSRPCRRIKYRFIGTLPHIVATPRIKPVSQMTDPIALPRAMSGFPLIADITETVTSGNVVPRLTIVAPMITLLIP